MWESLRSARPGIERWLAKDSGHPKRGRTRNPWIIDLRSRSSSADRWNCSDPSNHQRLVCRELAVDSINPAMPAIRYLSGKSGCAIRAAICQNCSSKLRAHGVAHGNGSIAVIGIRTLAESLLLELTSLSDENMPLRISDNKSVG